VEKQALQAEEAGIVIAGNHHDQETLGTLFHALPPKPFLIFLYVLFCVLINELSNC
jgi:hypothetical protein